MGLFLIKVCRLELSNKRNNATNMFLRLPILMLGTARVEGRSPPSTFTHHPPAQRDAVVGVLHVWILLELNFLETECQNTKTLLHSAVVKMAGKWQQVVLQHTNRTIHEVCQKTWQWEHLLPRGGTRADSTEALSRPMRLVMLAVIAATVFGRFILPPLEELFTGKSIVNFMEIQRARFAALQQDVRHLHNNLNRKGGIFTPIETHPNCTNCHFSPFLVYTPSNANSNGAYFVPTQTHPICDNIFFHSLYYTNWSFFHNTSFIQSYFFHIEPLNLSGIHEQKGRKGGGNP